MWEPFKKLFPRFSQAEHPYPTDQRPKYHDEPTAYTIRFGKSVPVDDAFQAWTSGDLDRMLHALSTKTNLIDRHFLLLGIVQQTYNRRSDPKMAEICAQIAELHLAEFAKIAPALQQDLGIMPRVPTFQHYATLLTERGDYYRAIKVCQQALSFQLEDGTKTGFEGRIERIRKKRTKQEST